MLAAGVALAVLIVSGSLKIALAIPKKADREALRAVSSLGNPDAKVPTPGPGNLPLEPALTPDANPAQPKQENETAGPIQVVSLPDTEEGIKSRAIFQYEIVRENTRPAPVDSSRIDELVFTRLKQLGIAPAPLCSDAVFVRRAYFDVIGTLPTAQEVRSFLQDKDPNKRQALIDQLLQRREYADYWAMKWSDLLRVKSEFPINLWPLAVQAYHRWIRTSIKQNLPYDRFVREMLTASGSNFLMPQVNFYRAVQSKEPQPIAQAVALNFMGVRPESWPKERWAGLAPFFAKISFKATQQWKEEIVSFDPRKVPAAENAGPAVFPDGTTAQLRPNEDPRKVFADWLIRPSNPWFTRNIVNRVWSWLLGRGIIHEPDNIRPDNLPSNPDLLAHLEREFAAANYDLKHLYRLILCSQTYQLSSIPSSTHPAAAANFAYYPLRRLEAEVLIDAICQFTGTTEKYSSPIPEPFTFIPEEHRSIALADGSITSPFLEMFGRPPRDTGLESERNNRPSGAQELHLLNSSHIQRKLDQGPKLQALLRKNGSPREIADELYLTILSRYPTEEEMKILGFESRPRVFGKRPGVNTAWLLMNSPEFLYRH
jgi:hypothetical protein